MEGNVLEMLAGHVEHFRRPAAITPADQLNTRVPAPHGFGKGNGLPGRSFAIEGVTGIRRLVSDLPHANVVRFIHTVTSSLLVVGIIAIAHPLGRFLRARRTNGALRVALPVLPSVRLEIHAH